MGSTVAKLDKSGWSAEMLARGAAFDAEKIAFRAIKAAKASHPLADALEGVTSVSKALSEAPRWKMIARDFGNGHRECVVAREHPDLAKRLEACIDRDLSWMSERGEGDREANMERAARRAKQKVRHLCKAMAVNSLWTLTYKENMVDRERALRDFDRFRRRVVALLGDWAYVAVFQQQDRGAWHVHMASHKLPARIVIDGVKVKSWDVMRRVWRSIAPGGNFDEAKRVSRWSKHWKPIRGCGAIAAYIAGYVSKEMLESELNRKRYSSSKGVEIPEAYRAMWSGEVNVAELIELAFAAVGDRITRSWYDKERGVFFIESDDSSALGLG